jgi:hypothetical protein|uniref:hypothetical protein n=1 Tax=Shewanella sp. TaxID=50422 RepID=UPI00404794D1
MKLTQISPITGKQNSMDIPLSPEEYGRLYAEWRHSPKKIHEVFRTLSREQCEFIMSGIAPDEIEVVIPQRWNSSRLNWWTVVLCILLGPLALALTLAYFPFLLIGIVVAWVAISYAGSKTK